MFSRPGIYILLIALLLVLGIIFLYIVFRKARRSAAPKDAMPVAADGGDPAQLSLNASSVGLKLSFVKAIRRIRAYGKASRYKIPWYLMMGESHSGKTTLLANTGMELLSEAPEEQQTGVKQGLNWFFFDQGIVLDVAGDLVLRADGATSNVNGWNYLTKLLRRYRPERPLDGIILTIPCSDLKGTMSQSPEFRLNLERKAQRLYSKLVDAQKRVGLSLPVYVLITKCDELTGFKSLCSEVPERGDEMFGWSSPYTREIAYRAEWVTEAFQNLQYYLFQLQLEVFTQRDRIPNSDEFFMLPSEVRAMRAPLQIYLDQIFKESAYHDPFFLRGIYLCGDGAGEAPASSVALTATQPTIHWRLPQPNASQVIVAATVTPITVLEKKHAFLGHLFERKIFQEELLARPINRKAFSRNRMVRVAQVLSLVIPIVGVLGILATYPSLKQREATYYSYLTRVERDLKIIVAEKASGFKDDQSRGRESQLFEAMSNMSGKSLFSLFIPGSWFSYVNERSGNSITEAYQFVVYETLRLRLDCRTESKLHTLPSSSYPCLGTGNEATVVSQCADDQSSDHVNTFIESLHELLLNRERYNRIIVDDGGNLDDLNKLLLYFNHAPLPVNFDTHSALYVEALRTARRPALQTTEDSVKKRAACKVSGMINDIYDETFRGAGVTFSYLGDIARTESLLARPENAWLADSVFEDPSPFRGMTLSAGVSELKRALNDLSTEKYQSLDTETQTLTQPEEPQHAHQTRSALVWDKATLQQAIDSYNKYVTFVENNSYDRPETLDYKVKQIALNDLRRKLTTIIPRALSPQSPVRSPGESAQKASLRMEIKSLEETQDLLTKVLDICRTVRRRPGEPGPTAPDCERSLRGTLVNQIASLLRGIDGEFAAAGFYRMTKANFDWWTLNSEFHSYIAFGASNPDELEVYLATQREGIADLANEFAAPVLSFMSALGITHASAVKWKQILEQLTKYEAKKPGNTVTVLENFVRTEMDSVKDYKCAVIVAGSSLQPLDYFIRVRNALRQPFYQRCEELALEETERLRQLNIEKEQLAKQQKIDEFCAGLKSYTKIRDAFYKNLDGKFPFSDLPQAEPFGEAEPDSINAFFEEFTKNKVLANSILEQAPKYGISNAEALLFLKRMETVGGFFSAFLDKKQQYPAFDFNLRFRTNEPPMIGGNQIIDWTFNVGGKRFLYSEQNEKPPEGIWGYGTPLSLSLRWANDSPTIPSAAFPPQAHMKLAGQTVTLRYDNNWSLLLLLLKNRALTEDLVGGVDVEPYTIKIEVPTEPNPKVSNILQRAQPETIKTPSVEIYMRVSLLTPSKKDPLILPDVFPTYAPQLSGKCLVIQQTRERRAN